ncbi:hypothetical protein RUM44_000734 [Polyplax serrata]|uniref:Uncharacterized protein n=1 Tax=Polyplax serrata TaxID=468196 RepID=A0ABR1B642_POLSC
MLKTVREQKKNSKLEMIDIQRDFEGIGYSDFADMMCQKECAASSKNKINKKRREERSRRRENPTRGKGKEEEDEEEPEEEEGKERKGKK